jgi:heat shock protein HspQ
MTESTCKFSIGQLVHHLLFDYRGVVVDVDATFQGPEEWYEQMAKSRPPKDEPWYHILVDQEEHTTYVAERNLEPDDRPDPIEHPLRDHFFSDFQNGQYICKLN